MRVHFGAPNLCKPQYLVLHLFPPADSGMPKNQEATATAARAPMGRLGSATRGSSVL